MGSDNGHPLPNAPQNRITRVLSVGSGLVLDGLAAFMVIGQVLLDRRHALLKGCRND